MKSIGLRVLAILTLAACGGGSSNLPVISALSAVPSVVQKGGTVNVAISASDPHQRALSYAWQASSGWTITPSADGTTATVVAPNMDGQQGTISVSVSATAKDTTLASILVGTSSDRPPIIASLSVDQTKVLPNVTIHAIVSASDPDGDTLSYTWASSDPTWTITGTTAAVTITAPETNGASTTLSVTVDDGLGGKVTGSVLLSTTACGAGALNCDGNDANGCETDSTTVTNCGACGNACTSGQVCDHGTTCRTPGTSCEQILEAGKSLGDGDYNIVPPGATDPIPVYCDMTTDGGGWTGFYAGINGASNAFDHFDYSARDCTDPDNHCLQRLPASEASAEIMSSCGAAKVAFHMTPLVVDYFTAGTENYIQPITNARTIAGTVDLANLVVDVYTGASQFPQSPAGTFPGFVIGNNGNDAAQTFAANSSLLYAQPPFDTSTPIPSDYCNGLFDESSPVKLFYRTKVARLALSASTNQDSGTPFGVQVTAYDPSNLPISTFGDTIHFTASNADVTTPADYTFVSTDAGTHSVNFTLTASGARTITATDTTNPALTASLKVQVATIGTPTTAANSCLQILKANAADGDGAYTLTSGLAYCDMTTDGGGWTQIYAGLNGSLDQSMFFEDGDNCPILGSNCISLMAPVGAPELLATCGTAKAAFFVTPPAAHYFQAGYESGWVDVVDPRVIAGGADLTTLTSVWTGGGETQNANPMTYVGYILGNPSTGKAFASASNDAHFDQCNGVANTGSATALYYRSRVDHFNVSVLRSTNSGTLMTLFLTAAGKNNQPVLDYTGTVHFTSSDNGATLPADFQFLAGDNGIATLAATLTTAGPQTITVTDTVDATLTGTFTSYVGTTVGTPSTPALTCSTILASSGSFGDGVYSLSDGVTPYQAYCDMTTDGGGWTLVLKADGTQPTFNYGAGAWTNASLVNNAYTDHDLREAKLQSWNAVPFTKVLVEMGLDPTSPNKLEITQTATSMFALMSPNMPVMTTLGLPAWETEVAEGSMQPTPCGEGFNIAGTNGLAVRIGALANEQPAPNCTSDDSRIGIGGQGASCSGDGAISVGNISSQCTEDHTYENLAYFGWVLVR
jgi:hypothetical protein